MRLPAGTRLQTFALVQARGDWDWLQTAFRFRHHAQEKFCWLCEASKTGPLEFRDFRLEARAGHQTRASPPMPGNTSFTILVSWGV